MTRQDGSISFYFFDFDDNSMFLDTPVFLRNAKTGEEKAVSTHEFATVRNELGKPGEWEDFEYYEKTYSHFRDIAPENLRPGQEQYFVQDIKKALEQPKEVWQAPAWPLLQYACAKQRPVSFITARGHSRDTIRQGVKALVDAGELDCEPNYLDIYAVSHPGMVEELLKDLSDEESDLIENMKDRTSALKRIAIHKIVDKALQKHGDKPAHRFGMSDDDPENIDLIVKAMCDCKKKYLDKRFFVINTHHGEHVKLEVFPIDFPVTREADSDETIG
ncbi:hypothetical protein [uncultured Ruegeria sp.]|uniref:hypothetical protein n=1 Tax=uncultured Ruegeria sp. TaxID=259304 RepID=UPI002616D4A6|nr:hypothetical protein [uncultured Ruegeria sp.]